jgi:peptidoglycan/xylan/chitin deacetylase (PgdA/CDA1 family)
MSSEKDLRGMAGKNEELKITNDKLDSNGQLKNGRGKFVTRSGHLGSLVPVCAGFGFVLLLSNPLTRPPAWLRPIFSGSEWRGAPVGPAARPRLYLTFDDGPIPEETPWVLEQLAAHQAKATFFCVGDNLGRYPDIARAALAAGHRLGNHTQHHRSAWNTPRSAYLTNVAECQQQLASLGALHLTALPLFRPPYGRLTWPVLRQLRAEYRVIMWSLLTRDYDRDLSPERALRLTLAATRPGDIVVLHDSRKASPSLRFLLPRLLAHYGDLGYEFVTL